MKIKTISHVLIGWTLVLAFVVCSLVAISWTIIQETTLRKEAVAAITRQISDLRFVSAEYLMTRDPRPLLQWELGLKSLRMSVSSTLVGQDEYTADFRSVLLDKLDRMQSYFETLRNAPSDVSFSGAQYRSARQQLLEVERQATVLVSDFNLRIAQEVSLRQYRAIAAWVIGVVLPILVLLFFLASWIPKKILSPLESFSEVIKEVGRGNFAYEFKFFSRDEFGDLADAARMMVDRLAEAEVLNRKELTDLRKEKQDLIKTNRLFIDRENVMVELKERLERLKKHDLEN